MNKVSLVSQIAEVDREIVMRERVYPGQVRAGKMRQAEADLLIGRMQAVRATLVFLQKHEAGIRDHIAATTGDTR